MNTSPVPIYGLSPNVSGETKPLTWRLSKGDAILDIDSYEQLEGYLGFKKVLTMTPEEGLDVIKAAVLKGRGGAGFPAGIKWSLMPPPDGGPRYMLCNADEMEPGTFKDRLLMERLPHQLIEGMLTSAYIIGATTGYIFLRDDYLVAAKNLKAAIEQARAKGYIGKNILGTGFDFELHVHTGAGRYICGEETALINCLEGWRANPRTKPPFPQVAGAWGRPSIVNNVETINNVPNIILRGAEWFKSLSEGKTPDAGTKLYGISGKVRFPGLWELPMGITARDLIESHGGGMQEGLELKCWLPGGASTDFLMPETIDLPMDYETIMKAGSRLGTGLIIVVDKNQDMVSLVRNLEEFFAQESCGWCVPCRDGLPWTVKILRAMEANKGQVGDMTVLNEMTKNLWIGRTFCALAPGAMEPLQSAMKLFKSEFEERITVPPPSPPKQY